MVHRAPDVLEIGKVTGAGEGHGRGSNHRIHRDLFHDSETFVQHDSIRVGRGQHRESHSNFGLERSHFARWRQTDAKDSGPSHRRHRAVRFFLPPNYTIFFFLKISNDFSLQSDRDIGRAQGFFVGERLSHVELHIVLYELDRQNVVPSCHRSRGRSAQNLRYLHETSQGHGAKIVDERRSEFLSDVRQVVLQIKFLRG